MKSKMQKRSEAEARSGVTRQEPILQHSQSSHQRRLRFAREEVLAASFPRTKDLSDEQLSEFGIHFASEPSSLSQQDYRLNDLVIAALPRSDGPPCVRLPLYVRAICDAKYRQPLGAPFLQNIRAKGGEPILGLSAALGTSGSKHLVWLPTSWVVAHLSATSAFIQRLTGTITSAPKHREPGHLGVRS